MSEFRSSVGASCVPETICEPRGLVWSCGYLRAPHSLAVHLMGRREKGGLFAEREKEELTLKRGPLFSVWQSESCVYFGNSAGKARLCVESRRLVQASVLVEIKLLPPSDDHSCI